MSKQCVCPWWLAYTFLIPMRKWQHNPEKILSPYIKKGMTVMDYGCAMGYFTIPMAQMTGATGKVYCVDIQDQMLAKLQNRAIKYDVASIVEPLKVGQSYHPANLKEKIDFILLFMVAHEVPDQAALFHDFYTMLKPGGKVLFFEPKGHVTKNDFERSLTLATNTGLLIAQTDVMGKGSLSALLQKN